MLKDISKQVIKSAPFRAVACWIAAQYMRLVWVSGRWHRIGKEHFDTLYDSNQPAILAMWHGRLLIAPYSWQKPRPFRMLISGHRDGELIAYAVKHLGISWIKGSSSKGGAGAFRQMIKALRKGEWVGITPDGPRGPRMRASDGVINLARLSGAPILPLGCGIANGKLLQTWDRFLIPLPFSKGVLIWGEPLWVPRDADEAAIREFRQILEDRISELNRAADRTTSRTPVEPGPEVQEQTQ
ncbi:MAG: lysophospholipid acyltransferase family protein [Rhodospirillales bacterium]